MMRRRRHDVYGCLRRRSDAARHDKRARTDGNIGHDHRRWLLLLLSLTLPRPRMMLLLRLLAVMLLRPPLLLLLRLPPRLLLLLRQHGRSMPD